MRPKYLYEITADDDRYIVEIASGVRDLDRALRRAGYREDLSDLAGAGTYRRTQEWTGDPDEDGNQSDWEDEPPERWEQPANPENQESDWTRPVRPWGAV